MIPGVFQMKGPKNSTNRILTIFNGYMKSKPEFIPSKIIVKSYTIHIFTEWE
ncbi:Putative protein [Zobellia galactanivorans]|uniref:Uncharacterized protein n=1 Tax=Zobellia galactanivorans (strain DSM 12802 / CCUG 47099 / CIP 106680 / NCIMB 13871 / Dsij) TaxID=63186 RepID=G0L7V7_ZOBGA|nr:Putative protein [Zobellia galactanivorans]